MNDDDDEIFSWKRCNELLKKQNKTVFACFTFQGGMKFLKLLEHMIIILYSLYK